MPPWILKLLQPLYVLLIDKIFGYIREQIKNRVDWQKDKKRLKEILDEKHPVKRANKLRDFINGR